jgi:hypothetical protein
MPVGQDLSSPYSCNCSVACMLRANSTGVPIALLTCSLHLTFRTNLGTHQHAGGPGFEQPLLVQLQRGMHASGQQHWRTNSLTHMQPLSSLHLTFRTNLGTHQHAGGPGFEQPLLVQVQRDVLSGWTGAETQPRACSCPLVQQCWSHNILCLSIQVSALKPSVPNWSQITGACCHTEESGTQSRAPEKLGCLLALVQFTISLRYLDDRLAAILLRL